MTVIDQDLIDLIEQFFTKTISAEVRTTSDGGTWAADVWQQATELELTTLGLDEDLGGAGGTLLEGLEVAMAVGKYAAPLPWAENFLARWVAGQAGVELPDGPAICLVITDDSQKFSDSQVTGTWQNISWAPVAEAFVVVDTRDDQISVAVIAAHDTSRASSHDIAGQPKAHVSIDTEVARISTSVAAQQFNARSLLLYSALLAGTMDGALAITEQYINERRQFGRPLAAFQSVQQHFVTLAQASSMSVLSVQRAALSEDPDDAVAATVAVRHHVDLAASAAHQAHGAMGMTREYGLQHLTRRMWLWRTHGVSDGDLKQLIASKAINHGTIMGLISRT